MAFTLIESCKYLPGNAAYHRLGLTGPAVGPQWSRVAGRNGGYAIRYDNGSVDSTYVGNGVGRIALPISASASGFSVGFAAKHYNVPDGAGTPSNQYLGVNIGLAGRSDWHGFSISTGTAVGAGATNYTGSSPFVIQTPVVIAAGWHWYNIVGILNSGAGYIRGYIDGVLAVQEAPDLVPNSPLEPTMYIYVGNAGGNKHIDFSDLLIRDDTTLIPDSRIDSLAPTSQVTGGWLGSDADSVNNHLLIDDAGPTVDASDYVSAKVAGLGDTYGMANLSHNPTTIYAVGVHALGRKDTGGSRPAAVLLNDVEGQTVDTNGTIYGYWETNPSGGAWTKTSVDAMTAGIRIKA